MMNKYFERIVNFINGPERTFIVKSVERGQEYKKKQTITVADGLGLTGSIEYLGRVKPITATLDVNEVEHRIESVELLEGNYLGSYLLLKEVELIVSAREPITMRASYPYNTGTLNKLAKYLKRNEPR